MVLKNEKGQTMVEYILLLAVAVSLVYTFYNSEAFRRLFGEQGAIGQRIKTETEFSYRHAYMRNRPANDIDPNNRSSSSHPSISDGNGSRFFGAKLAYP